jgi:hypothetical protein
MKMAIPTGRYTFYLQGEPYTVKITRKETGRRWTTLEILVDERWVEIHNPEYKKVILAKLGDLNTDLRVASYLYTRTHQKCGICGHYCDPTQGHAECVAKKFGEEVKTNA